MNVNEIYSQYMGLEEIGARIITGEIIEVGVQSLTDGKGGQKRRVSLRVSGSPKAVLLNATSAKAIARKFGGETDEWVGKEVVMRAGTVNAFGKDVAAMLVAPTESNGKPAF